MRVAGSKFSLVEPEISLQGVSGLETLVTGVVIECEPGRGTEHAATFAGTVPKDEEDPMLVQSRKGRHFRLVSSATSTDEGAPVLYRDLQVGIVLDKKLSEDGNSVELVIGLEPEHAGLVRENSVFWDERGLRGSIGFFNINIRTAIPLPIIGGGAVAFATPDDSAPRAAAGTVFTLHDKPQKSWRKWLDPSLH